MRSIKDFNFSGHKALVRVDFNVPLDKKDFSVSDDTRIRAAEPTIRKILNDGGSAILMSHLGRPKIGPEEKFSLRHIIPRLSHLLHTEVEFCDDCTGQDAEDMAKNLAPGKVLLLENLRFHPEEEKGDPAFAKKLASLGDVYVNDAFGTAHRAHASTATIAKYFDKDHRMFGLLMEAELTAAGKVLHHHEKPFTAIIGGAKVSDKILLLEKLMEVADNILIGGGMAYTFFRAQGHATGNSLCEEDKLDYASRILDEAQKGKIQFLLPSDSVIADAFSESASTRTCSSSEIPGGWMGLDIGPDAIEAFRSVIMQSKTILWNGPMGVFEMAPFRKGTEEVAKAVAEATSAGAYSLVGGGDSVSAVNRFGLSDKISYVSTGGGAMLEFFEGKTLPGVAAIEAD